MTQIIAAQVFLTFIVLARLGYLRVSKYRKNELVNFVPMTDEQKKQALVVENTANNFRNLFEMPMLFFVLCGLIFATQTNDRFYSIALSLFVITRYMHSFIHCTYNHIPHRFFVYAAGASILLVCWIRFLLLL